MPCQRVPDDDDWHYGQGPRPRYDDGSYDRAAAADGAEQAAKNKYDPLLCSACRALERFGYDFDENPALSVWWANHKAEDARKAAEAKAAEDRKAYRAAKVREVMGKPLNQLTDEERRLLREEGFLK